MNIHHKLKIPENYYMGDNGNWFVGKTDTGVAFDHGIVKVDELPSTWATFKGISLKFIKSGNCYNITPVGKIESDTALTFTKGAAYTLFSIADYPALKRKVSINDEVVGYIDPNQYGGTYHQVRVLCGNPAITIAPFETFTMQPAGGYIGTLHFNLPLLIPPEPKI